MGGKLSKKRKGYDVSDPKEKKDEVQATAVISEEPVQATAESSTPPPVGEAVESDTAAVTEAGAPEEPKPASPEEPAPVGPDKTAPSASEEPSSGGGKETESVPQVIQESSQGTVLKPADVLPEEAASKAVSEKPDSASEPNIEKTAPKATAQEEPVVAAAVEQICAAPVAPTEVPATPESKGPVPSEVEHDQVAAPESPAVVETVTVLEPQPEQEAGLSPTVPQDLPVVVEEIANIESKEPIPQTVSGTETTVMVTETVVPLDVTETKPVTELAVEQVEDSEKEQAGEEGLSQEPDEVSHEVEPEQPPEPEQSSEPEPKQSLTMEPEKAPEQEPEQLPDTEPEQPSEPETVKEKDAFEIIETDLMEAESHITELEAVKPEAVTPEIPDDLPEIPEKAFNEIQPTEEETDFSSVKAAEQEVTVTADEIVTPASVSPSDIPESEIKMENGELESPLTENVEEVNAPPAVNGECASPVRDAPQTEECVNGTKTPEEDPVSEQCHFELKKDMNLQEVPESVSEMVEGLSSAVTPAV